MQTTFPKIAAVLLTICAVAFMGLSVAAYFGRPNPQAEMGAEEISDYNFQIATGETTTWTVTPSVGANPSSQQFSDAYSATLHAFEDKTKRMTSETAAMNTLIEALRAQVTQVRTDQDLDVAALDKRIAADTQVVMQADQNLEQKSDELQNLSVQTADVRRETAKRREDVKRLQSELDELRTDRFRLEQILLTLTDRLVRLQLENQALELRRKQLASQTGQ